MEVKDEPTSSFDGDCIHVLARRCSQRKLFHYASRFCRYDNHPVEKVEIRLSGDEVQENDASL